MRRWEYDNIGETGRGRLCQRLNEAAKQGWELVSVTEDGHNFYTAFIRREIYHPTKGME